MIEDADTLDGKLAASRRLEADLSRAIAACQAAHDRGGIGYDEYLVADSLEKRLLAAGTALVARINEALGPWRRRHLCITISCGDEQMIRKKAKRAAEKASMKASRQRKAMLKTPISIIDAVLNTPVGDLDKLAEALHAAIYAGGVASTIIIVSSIPGSRA